MGRVFFPRPGAWFELTPNFLGELDSLLFLTRIIGDVWDDGLLALDLDARHIGEPFLARVFLRTVDQVHS